MIDQYCRPFFQKLCIDPCLFLFKHRSAMQMTAMGLFFGVLVAPLLALHLSFWAALSLLISGYFDVLDGSLARHQHKASPRGAVFDITADRLVELCVLLGLFLWEPQGRALMSFLMLGSILLCVTSFLVVGIFSENASAKSFHYSRGLIERAEAFLFWIAMMLVPWAFLPLSYLFTVLVLLTTVIRLVQFAKQS